MDHESVDESEKSIRDRREWEAIVGKCFQQSTLR